MLSTYPFAGSAGDVSGKGHAWAADEPSSPRTWAHSAASSLPVGTQRSQEGTDLFPLTMAGGLGCVPSSPGSTGTGHLGRHPWGRPGGGVCGQLAPRPLPNTAWCPGRALTLASRGLRPGSSFSLEGRRHRVLRPRPDPTTPCLGPGHSEGRVPQGRQGLPTACGRAGAGFSIIP